MLPPPEKHRSETDLRQGEAAAVTEDAAVSHAVPTRSESTTRLPYKKPTTIGSTDDILDEVDEEAKKKLRLKRFFESTTAMSAGPKSLPQSMTTAHQEMKAQLAAMQQQQQQHQGPDSIDISDMGHFFWGDYFGDSLSWLAVQTYREANKGLYVLLSRTQAGPGRTVKQEQEEISRNHVQTFIYLSVHT